MGKTAGRGVEVVETFLEELGKPAKFQVTKKEFSFPKNGEVHMMGGGRPPKKTTLEEDLKSFKDPAIGFADLLGGLGRGTTAAATGIAGDLEELYRQYGKGAVANAVRLMLPKREGKATTFPTIEEMKAILPPVVPVGASRSLQMADVGQFFGENNPAAPTAIAAARPVLKAATRGALDLAKSEPARKAVERVVQATGSAPMMIVPESTVSVGQVIKGAQDILPTAEREANLAEFLEGSAAQNRLYHGTGSDIQAFDKSKIKRPMFGEGFHLGESPALASFYAGQFKEGQNVMPVYSAIKKPFELKDMSKWYDIPGNTDAEKTAWIKSQGYDGIKYNHGAPYNAPNESGVGWVAFEPNQIKSAIGNRGTYDKSHKDIVKATGGAVMMADGGSADFYIDPSSYAQAKSKEMYPKKKSEWTERDAARHMLASGMMAQKFGPTTAKMAGLAHEHLNAPIKSLGYMLGLNKMPADYEQDLHNNALGIELAKRAVTQEELERFIKEMTSKSSKTKTEGVPFIGEPKNAARLSDY
jgi:hypothetical protein